MHERKRERVCLCMSIYDDVEREYGMVWLSSYHHHHHHHTLIRSQVDAVQLSCFFSWINTTTDLNMLYTHTHPIHRYVEKSKIRDYWVNSFLGQDKMCTTTTTTTLSS